MVGVSKVSKKRGGVPPSGRQSSFVNLPQWKKFRSKLFKSKKLRLPVDDGFVRSTDHIGLAERSNVGERFTSQLVRVSKHTSLEAIRRDMVKGSLLLGEKREKREGGRDELRNIA